MNSNFKYYNPTIIYFGSDSLKHLEKELMQVGERILLVYGQSAIKKIGLYDQIISILNKLNKKVFDDGGVMANPTVERVDLGRSKVLDYQIDFILAIGGGSVIDYAKAVAACTYADNWWQKYYVNMEKLSNRVINYGCLLTVSGTGSEMNSCSVITNTSQSLKIGRVFGDKLFPKFSIINPDWMKSVPDKLLFSGIYDSFTHLMEQYFSGQEITTSDYMLEGLMRCIYENSLLLLADRHNSSALSNLVWASTWALNTLFSRGRNGDWMLHMIGQAIGAVTDATHGLTLSAISVPYYREIKKMAPSKFERFGTEVFKNTDGLLCLEKWINQLGLVTKISDLGVKEADIDSILKAVVILNSGYKKWNIEEIATLLTI